MRSLLQLNDWLNSNAPLVKRVVRGLVPHKARIAFADEKFAATIDNDHYPDVFRNIYLRNWWGSHESISGCGSELQRTASVRSGLTKWLDTFQVESIFDAPCGDFNWMKEVVQATQVDYVGGDIVPELISKNLNSNHPGYKFILCDILKDPLPSVDAWICRDVLFHLPNPAIHTLLDRFATSDIRFFLTSHFENTMAHPEIAFGKYRPVNLCREPFKWPPPAQLIFDGDTTDTDRFLGIWENPRFKTARG